MELKKKIPEGPQGGSKATTAVRVSSGAMNKDNDNNNRQYILTR